MATCTSRVIPPLPAPPPQKEYTLVLNQEEARTLQLITRIVAGCPKLSRRKHVDSIRNALNGQGLCTMELSASVLTPPWRTLSFDEGM